ncbi:SLC13 family permease [Bacillus sp. 1P10SD]|uniref:SLC13 family permease n=1 Tax=Bacillus sp. 1P10SD TaxID=3132265 RepID=UPI0039A6566C
MKESVVIQQKKWPNLNFGLLKKDLVFTISFILAAISCFIHIPKVEYINFHVLISLFNLMLAIKALEELKVLDKFAISILNNSKNSKSVSAILILFCFFSSMLVTNDVALLTFVPLTLLISKKTKINMIETIILQTIAANIGSSLTPMGNPQNLFIYSFYGLKPLQFFMSVSFIAVLGIGTLFFLFQRLEPKEIKVDLYPVTVGDQKKAIVWGIVLVIIIASIFGVISYPIALVITLGTVFIVNATLIIKIDYLLLITFVCFFIFIGNISSTMAIQSFASVSMKDPSSVYFSSIGLSQLISNVPASILLAQFSTDWKPLLLGVNVGGLGTIIASLASVISYKLFIQANPNESKQYLIKFSIYNFAFLAFLAITQYLIFIILDIF